MAALRNPIGKKAVANKICPVAKAAAEEITISLLGKLKLVIIPSHSQKRK